MKKISSEDLKTITSEVKPKRLIIGIILVIVLSLAFVIGIQYDPDGVIKFLNMMPNPFPLISIYFIYRMVKKSK